MTNGSIIDILGGRIVEILHQACVVDVENPDYAATEVRQGSLQEDPVTRRIGLLVNPANPESREDHPVWSDKPTSHVYSGYDIAPYEIGGGERWWRRFKITVDIYLVSTQENRQDARSIGSWVFGKTQQALRTHKTIRDAAGLMITDEFGESAILMQVEGLNMWESGGPPSTFIWKGHLFVQVLTESV